MDPMLFRKKKIRGHEDSWTILQGSYEAKPLIVRLNTAARQLVGHGDYGIQVGVAVPFADADADGMPRASDVQALAAFEDDLVAAARGRAVLVAVHDGWDARVRPLHR